MAPDPSLPSTFLHGYTHSYDTTCSYDSYQQKQFHPILSFFFGETTTGKVKWNGVIGLKFATLMEEERANIKNIMDIIILFPWSLLGGWWLFITNGPGLLRKNMSSLGIWCRQVPVHLALDFGKLFSKFSLQCMKMFKLQSENEKHPSGFGWEMAHLPNRNPRFNFQI